MQITTYYFETINVSAVEHWWVLLENMVFFFLATETSNHEPFPSFWKPVLCTLGPGLHPLSQHSAIRGPTNLCHQLGFVLPSSSVMM